MKSGVVPLHRGQIDFAINIEMGEARHTLWVDIRRHGHPREARQAALNLKDALSRAKKSDGRTHAVFMAPAISPESARVCREENVHYLDFAGNGEIKLPGAYYHVEGRENTFRESRALQSLFSPKAASIIRVLLNGPLRSWKVEELAKASGASLGMVSNVRKLLLNQELAEDTDQGLRVTQPERLLNLWKSKAHRHRDQRVEAYSLDDIPDLEQRVLKHCRENNLSFGFTGLCAAARLAPFVPYSHVEVYVSNLNELLDGLRLKKIDSGGNITIIQPVDEGVFYQPRHAENLDTVSPVQIYVDLYGQHSRREEAADFLLGQIIRKEWQNDSL